GATAGGAVVSWLRGLTERWQADAAVPLPAPAVPGDVGRLDPGRLAAMVDGLGQASGPGNAGLPTVAFLGTQPRLAGDMATPRVSLGSAVELVQALFSQRGGIRAGGGVGALEAGQGTPDGSPVGIPADQWVVKTSLGQLVGVIPPGGVVLFFDDTRSWVAVDTTRGTRLVEFDPASSAGSRGQVVTPSRAELASLDRPGLGLVIDGGGSTRPAGQLAGVFSPATGWDGDLTAEPAGDLAPGISAAQQAWAREHQLLFGASWTGPNAVFDAVITAAGGRLTIDGTQVADAAQLRPLVTGHLPKAGAGRLGAMVAAAFRSLAQERILTEYLGNDLSQYHQPAVHDQISTHLADGAADRYIRQAFDEPGHWDQIVDILAPLLLADPAGINLLVVGTDGRVRAYGEPAAPRLVLARTTPSPATPAGWVALAPGTAGTPRQHTEPFARIRIDIQIQPTQTALVAPASAPAVLNGPQQQTADEHGLRVEPAPDDIYSAVLAAAGHALLIDRDTFITTGPELRDALPGLVRERPDLLDPATMQQISDAIGGRPDLSVDDIIGALTGPATPHTDQYARYLIGSYLGELRVIDPVDGAITTHGTGQPITIAPTTGHNGSTHWAALTHPQPTTPDLSGLPGLPDLVDRPPTQDWDPDHYTLQQPGTAERDAPWRNSTFCSEDENGNLTCVSVTVITLHHPLIP
ncbi:MAG TPA: hypothetical protein VNW94_00765, partial [Streptosporangiaceae bacterium]|nr:hypothetical protein [Streptosporangiaceae bacterium]